MPSTAPGLLPPGLAAREVTVMSRNVYVGTDLEPTVAAIASGDPSAIIGAVSQAWANVVATNFPERAEALADEIKHARPLLVGLQEVALFRTGEFDSFVGNPTQASHVEYDYLDLLLDALDRRGLHYAPAAVTEEFDAEFPGFTANGLQDIRLTDRDVILARTDVPSWQFRLSNVQEENFVHNVSVPVGGTGQSFTFLRGWASVDATVGGRTVRFVNAHLEGESANPLVNAIQVAQANELLAGPATTTLPVILAGDFNSRADGTGTATYAALIGAGFKDAWSATHPRAVGNTWGHDADLRNTTVNLTQRLDLVLYRGDLRALDTELVGEERHDRTRSGLWPSDHAGIVATLGLHARAGHHHHPADSCLASLVVTVRRLAEAARDHGEPFSIFFRLERLLEVHFLSPW
jgi:endonuclease/exonuclease/phosphatase family metal-dependent hydrolase